MTKEPSGVWEELPRSLISPLYTVSRPFHLACLSKRNDSLSYFTNGNNRVGEDLGEELGEKAFLRIQPRPGESAGCWPCHSKTP